MACLLFAAAVASLLEAQSRFNWTNSEGGPLVVHGDPIDRMLRSVTLASTEPRKGTGSPRTPRNETMATHKSVPQFEFTQVSGYLTPGSNLDVINVSSVKEAFDACASAIECRALCYAGGPNGTITKTTTVFLKRVTNRCQGSHCKVFPETSWLKQAVLRPPAAHFDAGGFAFALVCRTASHLQLLVDDLTHI
jgi:hypothetical protein